LHEAFTLGGVLPVGEPDFFHNVVNVRYNAFNNDVRIPVLGLLEQFRQGFFCSITVLGGVRLHFCRDHFLGQFKDLFQELQAGQKPLFVAVFDLFQTFAQLRELRITKVLAQSGHQHDFNLMAFPAGVSFL
jgi:hypothetical protein